MEHLPLPRIPCQVPKRVPYVCSNDEPYDGEHLLAYPQHKGCPEWLTSHTGEAYWFACQHKTIDDALVQEHEAFLQAWVFFGLLHMLLTPFDMYDAQVYIETDEKGKKWLTTRSVDNVVQSWHQRMAELEPEERAVLMDDARSCFSVMQESLLALNQEPYKRFSRMIKLSLSAISKLVESMIVHWLEEEIEHLVPMWLLQQADVDHDSMVRNGWCPSDIAYHSSHTRVRVSFLWYAEHVNKGVLDEQHDDCTEQKCERAQMRLKSYQSLHVTKGCTCSMMAAKQTDVLQCWRDGGIPMLEVGSDSIVVHSTKAADENTVYVALSHVWADGLGNPHSAALPTCQVNRIWQLVQSVKQFQFFRGKIGEDEEIVHKKRLLLWCDTLCCPVEPELKPLALGKMREVYEQAEFVLVLDRELESVVYASAGPVEAGWRLVHSHWMKRLWTFQEAGLPNRLLVQYKDEPVSVYPLMQTMLKLYRDSVQGEKLYNYITAMLVVLRRWRHTEGDRGWVSGAVNGIAHREVSVASDEPLCVATVLDLDTDRMAREPTSSRMQLLWQLICQHERGVQEMVIFHTLGRMRTPGFRWAPQSFLHASTQVADHVSMETASGRKAVLLEHGLKVHCAGWRIQLAQRPRGIPDGYLPDFISKYQSVAVISFGDTHYTVNKVAHDGIPGPQNSIIGTLNDRSKEWYLLHQKEPSFAHQQTLSTSKALIVSKETHQNGQPYYRGHLLVDFDRVQPRLELSQRLGALCNRSIRSSWTVATLGVMHRLEFAMDWLITRLPTRPGDVLVRWTRLVLIALYCRLLERLTQLIVLSPARMLARPEVAKQWQAAGETDEKLKLGGGLLPGLMGRYIDVLEVFDTSTEWVVD